MNVRPLEDLIERYDEIYESCRKTGKPVFLTKDGEITLVVMALDDYMKFPQRMEIVEDKDEGGYKVYYPDLPGCISCGDTVEEAIANAEDAKKAWIEAILEENDRDE